MARCVDAERLAFSYMEAANKAGVEELEFLTPGDVARTILKCADSCEEIAPVVHAHWCVTDAYPHNVYCSRCLISFAQTHWPVWEDNSLPRAYCPACGAIMDEVTEE